MRARLRPGSGWAGPGFRTALGSNYTDCDPKRPGRTAAAKTSARSPGANFITGPWFPGETAHPEFQPASWPTERLALTPLPQHATLAQLRSDLPQSVGEEVDARGDGKPLFIEELARGVEEGGAPESLAASLMARLDRLGPARELLGHTAQPGEENRRSWGGFGPVPECQRPY